MLSHSLHVLALMMNFREQTTNELSALIDRLSSAAEAAAKAAAADAQATAQTAIDALQAERTTLDRALQEEKRARQAADQARAGLEKTRTALDKARIALEKERDTLKSSLESAKADHAAATRDLQTKLEAARTESVAARRELQAKLDASLAESTALRESLEAQLADAQRAAAEAINGAKTWRAEQLQGIREQAVTFVARSLDRLLAVSESFAGVSTADDVLAAMVGALSTEFSRVALFNVAGNRLDGVQHVGFEFPSDMSHLVIPHEIDSALTRAITSGQIEMLPASALEAASGTAFGGTPKCALALPLDIDGEPFAVIYADDSDQPHQAFANVELRRKFAALLRQQAVPLLMRLPTEMKAVAEFREYAARLVAELENMYAADVAARKKGDELRRRLKDNVECARGIYSQRVAAEAPSASGLFEEELALVVAAKRSSAYGRDLAAVLAGGAEEPAGRPHAARAH